MCNAQVPTIADPVTCGEDLPKNLKRMIQIAPDRCAGCSDYHIFNAAKRISGHTPWNRGGRAALLQTLRPIFAELNRRKNDRIDIVVAAAADTAVLSTAAHAACLAGEAVLRRSHFTVIDRCRSPLLLCEEYAATHGLRIETDIVDLLAIENRYPADLVILHNFLSFVPMDKHAALLKGLGAWLHDGGRIVLWNAVLPPQDHDRIASHWQRQIADVKAMVVDGSIEINEPRDVFFSRIERNVADPRPGMQRFADTEALASLFASVGLVAASIEWTSHHLGNPPTDSRPPLKGVTVVAGRP